MSIKINQSLTAKKLVKDIERMFAVSAPKMAGLQRSWKASRGAPVFTVKGKYTTLGWTEWTQGFQHGSALLQYDATADERFLEMGRRATIDHMASHVSHIGVHDHGFNNISTYGNLWRLMGEGKVPFNEREKDFYELALKISGAVQASRWTPIADGRGYIYSFNGPHSLFIDTIRSLRALAVSHRLGHVLMGERDAKISLLRCLVDHADTTAEFGVYYGTGRDHYDVRGRTAHESIFNLNDGNYRCPNSQQGFSPFSTWTRGVAWAITGYAEQLEFFRTVTDEELQCAFALDESSRGSAETYDGPTVAEVRQVMLNAAKATADFYLEHSCRDGVPVWDTGAPNLHRLGNYAARPSDPYNRYEPVDSSAAAIAAQGLVRLGNYLTNAKKTAEGTRYRQAGLTVTKTLLNEPYLSLDTRHQGLLLHSIYHRPNGWDFTAPGQKVPNGESSMWGDYHLRELALLLWREAREESYLTFFGQATTPIEGKK